MFYPGFRTFDIQTSDPQCKIHGVVGGSGPPVLLIHGNPLTHVDWHIVGLRLAERFTVVATDLRGYGDSGKPRGLPDHSNYTFRLMAQDQVDVMVHLGFGRFMVAGHDRGARTAFRMALDYPDKVQKSFSNPATPVTSLCTWRLSGQTGPWGCVWGGRPGTRCGNCATTDAMLKD